LEEGDFLVPWLLRIRGGRWRIVSGLVVQLRGLDAEAVGLGTAARRGRATG